MQYVEILVAIAVLLLVILVPTLIPPSNQPLLTDVDVAKIAENYVETTIQGAVVTGSSITGKTDAKWKITVNYQTGSGSKCKVGKCYWEGPASMYCRPESNQTLGQCN